MKAWELLDKPEKWTQGAFARDAIGRTVMENSPNASCWCLSGAVGRCYTGPEADNVWMKLMDVVGISIIRWNDAEERTHDQVLTVLKELDI